MVRRTDSRRRMLDAAAELFQEQGYHATGLTQLVTVGGAPKGSLYFHFPGGKEQLAAEAVALSAERIGELLSAVVAPTPDPAAGIAAAVDALTTMLTESDFRHGCPLATVALEAGDSTMIREACQAGYDGWHTALVDYLTQAGLAADKADPLATVVLAALEGALLLAKTRRDVAPLRAVADHLRTTVEREFS